MQHYMAFAVVTVRNFLDHVMAAALVFAVTQPTEGMEEAVPVQPL